MISTLRNVVFGHRRTFIALAVVCLAYLACPHTVSRARGILAWDTGVVSFLVMVLHLFLTRDTKQMPALAEAQRDGEWTIFWIAFLVSVVSFFAVMTELPDLKDLSGQQRVFRVAVVAATLILSWLLTHVVFALRYAHEWYAPRGEGRPRKGLEFPGDQQPDYMDFLYFSLVLGMTFQVSDVAITARKLRRLAALHGLIGFLFNATILALAVNLAAGFL